MSLKFADRLCVLHRQENDFMPDVCMNVYESRACHFFTFPSGVINWRRPNYKDTFGYTYNQSQQWNFWCSVQWHMRIGQCSVCFQAAKEMSVMFLTLQLNRALTCEGWNWQCCNRIFLHTCQHYQQFESVTWPDWCVVPRSNSTDLQSIRAAKCVTHWVQTCSMLDKWLWLTHHKPRSRAICLTLRCGRCFCRSKTH